MEIYDLTYLKEISAGDDDFVTGMIQDFINDTPGYMERLKNLSDKNSWKELYTVAHTFASTVSFIGSGELMQNVKQLEDFCQEESNLDRIPELITSIESISHDVILALKNDFNY